MKSILCSLFIILLCIGGCGVQELRKDAVASMLRKELKFPKTFSLEIDKTDPAIAEKLINAGLETAGLVSIKKIVRLNEIGKPLMKFSKKASPFLLPPSADNSDNIQSVKIADIEFSEVTLIRLESRFNFARIEYTLVYKNITPFAALINKDLTKSVQSRVFLKKNNGGWLLAR